MRVLCLAIALAAPGLLTAQDFPSALGHADSAVQDAQSIKPDSVKAEPDAAGQLKVRVLIEQDSHWLPVPYLAFHATIGGKPALAATSLDGEAVFAGCQGQEQVVASANLTEASFAIQPLLTRRLVVQGACGTTAELRFRQDDPDATALRVWRVATKAQAKLAGTIGPSAWPKAVVFHVNSEGATSGTNVGVSPNSTTFVVGHELGHAISNAHQMIQTGFGDSFHQMTGCIGESAALEEGWASFFGAWVDQGFDTIDPAFEWDHRQRIPLKILPDDVQVGTQGERAKICAGTDNEMRVTSFLWNVTAPDGLGVPMPLLWKTLEGKHLASVAQVARGLETQGVDRAKLATAWTAAFKQSYPPSL